MKLTSMSSVPCAAPGQILDPLQGCWGWWPGIQLNGQTSPPGVQKDSKDPTVSPVPLPCGWTAEGTALPWSQLQFAGYHA